MENTEDLVERVILSLGRIQLANEVSQETYYNPNNPFDALMLDLINLYALGKKVPPKEVGRRYIEGPSFAHAAVEWAKGLAVGDETSRLYQVLVDSPDSLKRLSQLVLSPSTTLGDLKAEEIRKRLRELDERKEDGDRIAEEISDLSDKQLIVLVGPRETNVLHAQLKDCGEYAEIQDEVSTLGFGYNFAAFYHKASGKIFIRPSCIDFYYAALNALIDGKTQFDGYRRKGLEIAQEFGEEVRDYDRFHQNSLRLALLHEQGERKGDGIVRENKKTDFIDEDDPEKRDLANRFFLCHPSGHDLHAEHYALTSLNGDANLVRFKLLDYLLTYSEPSYYSNIMISCLLKENPAQELSKTLADIGKQVMEQNDPFSDYEETCRREVEKVL
jgi:hypothetical protein